MLRRARDRFGIKLLSPPEACLHCAFLFFYLLLSVDDAIVNLLDVGDRSSPHNCCIGFTSRVVFLYGRKWIEDTTYPRFTMIGQSFGSVYISWEAWSRFTPVFYFDTNGYAFTYPVARLFGCQVVCCTHYPTISLDMLSRVLWRSSMFNNKASIVQRDLVNLRGSATAGLHSTIDELFGIRVVEFMAAGAIPIAHNSAGLKMDIVLEEDSQQTGFLTETVKDYADAILLVVWMPEDERLVMAAAARKRASRFSEQRFYDDLKATIIPIMKHSSS